MLRKRRNPEKREVRKELVKAIDEAENNLNLEKVLWILYNPTGLCEECGHLWNDFSCSCRNCEDLDQIINEPCGNTCVCVCNYFDGGPEYHQVADFLISFDVHNFLLALIENELTQNERDYKHNIKIKPDNMIDNICDVFLNSLVNDDMNHSLNRIRDLLHDSYIDYKNIYKNLLSLLKDDYDQNDKIEISNQLLNIIDNYVDFLYIEDIINNDLIKYIYANKMNINSLNKKYLQHLIKKIKNYRLTEDSLDMLKYLEDKP